ncbi:hypothetical protein BDW62DRAFT_198490 [Aspergillus aurantiobrunneus]
MSPFGNVNNDNRRALIRRIQDSIFPRDPVFWAFTCIADMDKLESVTELEEEDEINICGGNTWTKVLKTYDYTCLITGTTDSSAQATRICRFAPVVETNPMPKEDIDMFWELLSVFWPRNRVRRWKWAVSNAKGPTNIIKNMLCLSEPARRLWKEGKFALKPVAPPDPTGRSLTVEFYWLWARPDESAHYAEALGLDGYFASDYPILFNEDGDYIRSGDIFTFTTDDPVWSPLPSVELLDMQWVMNRLVGLTRAKPVIDDQALLDIEDEENIISADEQPDHQQE